jgi:tripartite-type tricarboxylate transporter receptor subunit TctC
MKEQGVDISFPGLNFLAVQAETDDAVVNYLYTKFKQICDSPEYQTFVKNSNIDYCPMSPSEIDAYIKNQQAVAAKLSD